MNLALAILAGGYALMSLLTYATYAWDKSAARHHRRRVRVRTLHLLALVGGWPGALLAQRLLRHKTSQPSFLALYWLTVVLNCMLLGLAYLLLQKLLPSFMNGGL